MKKSKKGKAATISRRRFRSPKTLRAYVAEHPQLKGFLPSLLRDLKRKGQVSLVHMSGGAGPTED